MNPRLFTLALVALMSCKKDSQPKQILAINYPGLVCTKPTNQIDTVRKMIIGTYDWSYTFYRPWRAAAEIWTPQNKGLNYRYIFKPNGEVDYVENSKLKWTNKFEVDYEFKVSTYPSDMATMIIISDRNTGQRLEYFRAYLCNDSARFYNPFSSFDIVRYFGRK